MKLTLTCGLMLLFCAGIDAGDDPDFELTVRLEDGDAVVFDTADSSAEFCVVIALEQASSTDAIGTNGFCFGILHDPEKVENVSEGASSIGVLADLNDGAGPDFFSESYNASSTGFTVGCVYNLNDTDVTLEFDTAQDIVRICYETVGEYLEEADGDSTALEFSDSLAIPPVAIEVFSGEDRRTVGTSDLTVEFLASGSGYIRGDCNDDGRSNMADGVHIINALFHDSEFGDCFDSCDANDDNLRDQSDAIYIWNYRFLDGPEPSEPFPDCGFSGDFDEDCAEDSEFCADS